MANKRKSGSKHDQQWSEAKRRCRLKLEDIRIAKEVGLTPRSLIKNIPSPKQHWKLPVKQWIHELYEEKTGNFPQNKRQNSLTPERKHPAGAPPPLVDQISS
jgi:hypothetical protein